MKIFLDCTFLKSKHTGVELAFLSLIKEVLDQDALNEYTILIDTRYNSKDLDNILSGYNNSKLVKLYSILPLQVFYSCFLLPFYLRFKKIDVYHGLFYFGPIIKFVCPNTKIVITVYDLYYRVISHQIGLYLKIVFNLFAGTSIKKADKVIVISKQTETDVIKYLKIPKEKINLIYLSLTSNFDTDNLMDSNIEKFGLVANQYILTVSTVSPSKGLRDLIQSFAILQEKYNLKNIKLVSAGKPIGNYVSELKILINELGLDDNTVKILGYISDFDLKDLYSHANLFVLPSHYEGFGLTLLEAMKFGKPIIARNASSLKEVVGNAGLLFNNCDEMASQIYEILTNLNLRNDLIAKGFVRLKEFSWVEAAKKTLSVYNN